MHEFFPVIAGIAVGMVAHHITTPRLKVIAVLVLSTLIGAIASLLTGELMISWIFLILNIGQVLLGTTVTVILLDLRQHQAL